MAIGIHEKRFHVGGLSYSVGLYSWIDGIRKIYCQTARMCWTHDLRLGWTGPTNKRHKSDIGQVQNIRSGHYLRGAGHYEQEIAFRGGRDNIGLGLGVRG